MSMQHYPLSLTTNIMTLIVFLRKEEKNLCNGTEKTKITFHFSRGNERILHK